MYIVLPKVWVNFTISVYILESTFITPDDVFDEVDTALSVGNLRERLTSRLARHTPPEENKPDRDIRLNLSVTGTDFVVVEDMTSLESNAVVLKVCNKLDISSCIACVCNSFVIV